MSELLNITVLGAGSWGTALARVLAIKGHRVRLWAYEQEVAEGISRRRRNPLYLSEVRLPKGLYATNSIPDALKGAKLVVSVVPSHAVRGVMKEARGFIPKEAVIVSCTKGIETETGKLISEILEEGLPEVEKKRFTYLSGPSFAIEVARDLPTTVVVAGTDPENTKLVQDAFRTKTFLTFTHNDVVGVELGGALKNVIAIAAGVSDGLGFGDNSRAALITRGLYEIIKIGKALGANPLTFTGLSGMGDLILTCTSKTSRNYTFGYKIGRGKKASGILKDMVMVVEGVKTAKAVHELALRHRVKAPICEEIYNIIYNDKSAKQVVIDLTEVELSGELRKIL